MKISVKDSQIKMLEAKIAQMEKDLLERSPEKRIEAEKEMSPEKVPQIVEEPEEIKVFSNLERQLSMTHEENKTEEEPKKKKKNKKKNKSNNV